MGGLTRRETLHWIGAAALVSAAPLAGACSPAEATLEDRLANGIAGLAGDPEGARALASAAPMPRADALAHLRGETPAALVWAATATRAGLRAFLTRARTRDLAAGRTRWVRGWLVTESELAAAALLAG